jgi:hypothetical protein
MPHQQIVETLVRQGARAGAPPEVQLSYAVRHLAVALEQKGLAATRAVSAALSTAAKATAVVGTVIQIARFALRLLQEHDHDRGR